MERLLLLALSLVVVLCHEQFQVIFEWKSIDFQWPSEEARKFAVLRGDYIASNNFITTVKFWKDKMYLTLPRWRDGVPVTLGVTSAKPVKGDTAPLLDPFPNWDMQKLGDCSAFQLVHSMEIDPKGRMWVLDTGRSTALSKENKGNCPARLVILDLEDNGKVIHTYEFPDHVARRGVTYLNDIVLDHENGGMAFITDNGRDDPGIIVYSVKNNTSWKIRHDSMKAKAEAVGFMVAKTHVINPVHVEGIALSPASSNNRFITHHYLRFICTQSLYLLRERNTTNIDQYVSELGRKSSQTDGMAMSATGVLYFGLLADDAIAMWDTKITSSFNTGQRIITRDHLLTQWPDSFTFDEDGNFWCVSNTLQNFLNNRVNISVPNYRLIRTHMGVKNYQYYENGTAPEWPDFTAGAESVKFALATLLVVILVFVAK